MNRAYSPGAGMVGQFFAQPWRERRLIVAVGDNSAIAQQQQGARGGKPGIFILDHKDDKGKLIEFAGRALVGYATFGLSEALIFGAKGAKHVYDKWQKGAKAIQTPMNFIPIPIGHLDCAVEQGIIRQPAGGFDYNTAYVGHPHTGFPKSEPAIYEPLASFHEFLFEDKAAEISRLLAALGTTWYRVTQTTKGQRGKSGIGGLNIVVMEKRIGISDQATEGMQVSWETRLAPDRPIFLPNDLVWYPHERSWQHVVDMRFNTGVTNFRFSLEYRRDYQINADVALALEGIGINLGGKFINYEEIIWEIEGEYAPKHTLGGWHCGPE